MKLYRVEVRLAPVTTAASSLLVLAGNQARAEEVAVELASIALDGDPGSKEPEPKWLKGIVPTVVYVEAVIPGKL